MSYAPPRRSQGPGSHASRQAKRFVPRTDDAAAAAVPPSSAPSAAETSTSSSPLSSQYRNSAPESQNARPRSLTASLRGATPSSSSSGPPSGESGREEGIFVSYLPQDEAVASGLGVESGGLDAVESQAVVDVLNGQLSRLLKMKPREFWKEVASSDALHEFLDSYLQFRNRWYDFPHRGPRGTIAGIIIGEDELSRRVFLAFYRMSSNKEPGVHSGCSLNAKEHAAILQEKKLLDLPKLLDICAIYGHDNNDLTRTLVTSAIKSQPRLINDLGPMLFHFLSIIHTMHQRCSSSVQGLISTLNLEVEGLHQLHMDFSEVMDFINDCVVTLDAFVDAYRPAAVYLSFPVEMSHGNEELLNLLARLHDSLIPNLYQGFTYLSRKKEIKPNNSSLSDHANIVPCLKMLSMRIIKFGWKLLDICYLSDEPLEVNLNLETTTKIFPSRVEDPSIRGDILIQTFREINDEVSSHIQDIKGKLTFIQGIEKHFGLLRQIGDLQTKGWICMDSEQFNYLTGFAKLPPQESWKKEEKVVFSSVGNTAQKDDESVITESKISQIKDLFPDCGSGFLAACLDAYDHNPEEVIQRILEGTLHEDLLSLDRSLEQIPPAKSSILGKSDKGKAVIDSTLQSRSAKGKEVLMEPEAQVHLPSAIYHSVEREKNVYPPSMPVVSHGRYTRKTTDELPDSEVLNSKSAKDSVRSSVLQSQYEDEYEDEYDDSFDELGLSIVESGFEAAETSGERISGSLPGNSASLDVESSKASSRWRQQKQPQFYVKDGKNYGYKVSGSVAVRSTEEAELVNQAQKKTIYGLGRGGNLPLGAVRKLIDAEEQGNEEDDGVDTAGQGHVNSRGRGRRGGGSKHHRKDRAVRKAFAGLTTR